MTAPALTATEAATVTGWSYAALRHRVEDANLLPAKGNRNKKVYTMPQALGLAVAKCLLRLKVDTDQAQMIVGKFWPMTEADLLAQFAAGCSWLIVIGRAVSPEMVTEAETKDSPGHPYSLLRERGIEVSFINVAAVWRKLNEAVTVFRERN
jgi:hypothetical protein